ncbi:hypothetical protein L218DRAFT_900041 [Marasmius fiardii PR-910]|nr:hypothetical protein L218DRAFT_900041 [Marasmius fiardii PR-910]
MSGDTGQVAVFWDYENCRPPSNASGYSIVNRIREVAQQFGCIKLFRGYSNLSDLSSPRSLTLRSELQSSGVSLIDCPHNGRKNVADQMMIVDMLTFAIDNDCIDSTVLLISGDRDFAYPISILRFRMYQVVVVSPSAPGAHLSLRAQASTFLDWNTEILNNLKDERLSVDPELSSNNPLPPVAICDTSRFNFTVPPPNFIPRAKQRADIPPPPLMTEGTAEPTPSENVPPMYTPNVVKPKTTSIPSCTPSTTPSTPPTSTPALDSIAQHILTGLQQQLDPPQPESSLLPSSSSPSSLSAAQPSNPVELNIPQHIQSLVRTLQKYHENGNRRPLRSVIALELVQKDGMVYRKAGVTRFRDFCAIAIDAKLVTVGGTGGNAWISLNAEVLAKLQSSSS